MKHNYLKARKDLIKRLVKRDGALHFILKYSENVGMGEYFGSLFINGERVDTEEYGLNDYSYVCYPDKENDYYIKYYKDNFEFNIERGDTFVTEDVTPLINEKFFNRLEVSDIVEFQLVFNVATSWCSEFLKSIISSAKDKKEDYTVIYKAKETEQDEAIQGMKLELERVTDPATKRQIERIIKNRIEPKPIITITYHNKNDIINNGHCRIYDSYEIIDGPIKKIVFYI